MDDAENHVWRIYATLSLQTMVDDHQCPPFLRRLMCETFSWQMRNETPVQKALRSPHMAPRWMAALLALGATVTVEGEENEMPLELLLQSRRPGNITALHIAAAGLSWGEACVARTPADNPIVAVAATAELEDGIVRQARIALAGVWSEPVRLARAAAGLSGHALDGESIRATARAVESEVTPHGDFLGSAGYRRAMAGVLTRRALEQCKTHGQK